MGRFGLFCHAKWGILAYKMGHLSVRNAPFRDAIWPELKKISPRSSSRLQGDIKKGKHDDAFP